jgi:DNA-binding response OmpR family regulator
MNAPKTILVIEDDEHMRHFINVAMRYAGYEVHLAKDGSEGMAKAIRLRPDLIILDVMMPGEMDGLAVCHVLRHNEKLKRVPVLILSGLIEEIDVRAGHLYGCTEYLTKPVSIADLQNAVHTLLQRGDVTMAATGT